MRFNFLVKTATSLLLHISALSIILFAYLSIAQWYFFHRPILGVDFFNTVTYSRFLRDHFHILPYGFKYFWYGGSPIAEEIVLSWFLPFSFFARIFPLFESVKIASLIFFFLLSVFVYLASYRLSKNHMFSALVAVLVIFSANMYGSLVWGGSLPYFANQLFFPAALWSIASYLETGNKRWYWISVLIVGLSFFGHLGNGVAFVLFGVCIILLFGKRIKHFGLRQRLSDIIILFFIVILFSYRIAYPYLRGYVLQILQGNVLTGLGGTTSKVSIGTGGITVTGDQSIINFERSLFLKLFSDTHSWLFIIFGIAILLSIVGFIVDRKKKNVLSVFAWLILAGYSVFHVYLNSNGIQFFSQAWYRAFWHFPVTLGLAAAALFGYSHMAFTSFSKILGRVVYLIITFVCIIVLGGLLFSGAADKTIQLLETRSSPSSAHPEAINLVRDDKELNFLKKKLVPAFVNANDRNYRLFTSDAQVNVWWNALFDMPLARGYLDPPIGTGRAGHYFLLDQAIGGDGLVLNFGYSPSIARNMALYYIDWYAVKYIEGGRLSQSPNKPPSSYIKDIIDNEGEPEFQGVYVLVDANTGKWEVRDGSQILKYYRFSDNVVTPLLSVNNSPAVLCLCDFSSYESLTKILGMNNINSKFLVSVFSEDFIDSFSQEDLANFDMIIISGYKYRNRSRAFARLKNYVQRGGKLFVDTGGEVPESDSVNLPDIIPFTASERKGLGKKWEVTSLDTKLFEGVRIEDFSPPIFNDSEWKFSYPLGKLKPHTTVLLEQKNKPLLIKMKLGEGEVIWSGMNLAYHIHSHTNPQESILFINILNYLVPLTTHEVYPGKPNFKKDNYVEFSSDQTGRGVLFKEEFYNGWKVSINGRGTRAYAAGPTYPGFIYLPIDDKFKNKPIKVSYSFWGRPRMYIEHILTLIVGLFLLDLSLLDGRILGRRIFLLVVYLRKRMGMWWQKEEE